MKLYQNPYENIIKFNNMFSLAKQEKNREKI